MDRPRRVSDCPRCATGIGTPTGRETDGLEIACERCGEVWYVTWNPMQQRYGERPDDYIPPLDSTEDLP